MNQIPLRLRPVVSYTADNFILHSGVSRLFKILIENIYQPEFSAFYIFGRERSGKTHLAIKLGNVLGDNGFYPRILTGAQLKDAISEIPTLDLNARDVFIIDSAEQYFNLISPGLSGEFVAFFEACRNSSAKIIILSVLQGDCFNVDDHILSRFRFFQHFSIEAPQDLEFAEVITALARQRGLALTSRHIEFLHKRISHSIADMEEIVEKVAYLKSNSAEKISLDMITKVL